MQEGQVWEHSFKSVSKGQIIDHQVADLLSSSLLISLSIFRSLASECRRDIALLSPSLIGSVEFTLASVPTDLEVVARGASVVCTFF